MIGIVLTIIFSKGWVIRHLNINNVILNGFLAEDVYMMQREGFINPERQDFECKFDKTIYGLKQAPYAWFDRFENTLITWDFNNSKCDISLLLFILHDKILFILVYVDHILVTGNDQALMQTFICQLNKIFVVKGMRDLHHFLGIKVYRDETRIYLTQSRYI